MAKILMFVLPYQITRRNYSLMFFCYTEKAAIKDLLRKTVTKLMVLFL